MKNKTPSAHPAASAAESDLIKLTREFESLRKQLEENDNAVNEHNESIRASHINHDVAVKFHTKKVEHLRRLRRTLEAQFTNVNELLRPLVETERADIGCIETPYGRLAKPNHPLFER